MKYQAVTADGLSISQVAEKVGVSRQTLHAWLARYEAEGLEGLKDQSHRPARCPHQMGAGVEVVLLELRRSRPYWGPRGWSSSWPSATKARGLKQKTGLPAVVVDYPQLMTSGKRVESRQAEVEEFSRSLKLLAKELDVPVIAVSQLNRGPEQRTDRTPQLSDLRESGQLEQDSDMVILIHRPDAYDRDSPRSGEADLILAKQRNGRAPRTIATTREHVPRSRKRRRRRRRSSALMILVRNVLRIEDRLVWIAMPIVFGSHRRDFGDRSTRQP